MKDADNYNCFLLSLPRHCFLTAVVKISTSTGQFIVDNISTRLKNSPLTGTLKFGIYKTPHI